MNKQELNNEILETWKAIKAMENNRSCWEMGDSESYERLLEELNALNAKYEAQVISEAK